jgi:hypothetical protein
MLSKLISKGGFPGHKSNLFVCRIRWRRGIVSEAVIIEIAKGFVAIGTLTSVLVFTQNATNKRFEDSNKSSEKRFEDLQKSSDKRFEASDKRFADLQAASSQRLAVSNQRFADLIGSLKDGKVSDALVKTAEASAVDIRFKNLETVVEKSVTASSKKWV